MSLLYDWDLGEDCVVGEDWVVESGVVGMGLDLGVGRVDRASFREPCLFMFFL